MLRPDLRGRSSRQRVAQTGTVDPPGGRNRARPTSQRQGPRRDPGGHPQRLRNPVQSSQPVPAPVALVEVSIFTDPRTGGLWAEAYELPPREHSPHPLPPRCVTVAEPDGHGGIARLRACWCGRGCVCPTCGEQTVQIPTASGVEWATRSCSAGRHAERWCSPSPSTTTTWDGPECCAFPMRLAPVAWMCNRESAHQRPTAGPTSSARLTVRAPALSVRPPQRWHRPAQAKHCGSILAWSTGSSASGRSGRHVHHVRGAVAVNWPHLATAHDFPRSNRKSVRLRRPRLRHSSAS